MSSAPPDVFGATNETPLRSSIRDSLAEWTKCALGPLDQEPAAHHQHQICDELEDISTGANTRLIVLMPPGSAKSTYASEYVDARVFRLGDTMTGPLILSGDPTTALEATTEEYTDGQFAKSLPAAGGTMTGPLTLAANPTSTLQAAPRQYVDDQVATALPLTGGSLSGAFVIGWKSVRHGCRLQRSNMWIFNSPRHSRYQVGRLPGLSVLTIRYRSQVRVHFRVPYR